MRYYRERCVVEIYIISLLHTDTVLLHMLTNHSFAEENVYSMSINLIYWHAQ